MADDKKHPKDIPSSEEEEDEEFLEENIDPQELLENKKISEQLKQQLQSGEAIVLDDNDTLETIQQKLSQVPDTNKNASKEEQDEETVPDSSKFQLDLHSDAVYTVSVFEDPKQKTFWGVSGGGDDKAFLFDVETGKKKFELVGHKDTVISVAFNSTGTLVATASYDHTVKVWNVSDGSLKATLDDAEDSLEFVQWHPKGDLILAGGSDYSSRLWSLLSAKPSLMQTFFGHSLSVTCGVFSSDGKLIITGSEDGYVKTWKPNSSSAIASLQLHVDLKNEIGGVNAIAPHPSDPNLIMTFGVEKTAKLIDLSKSRVLQTWTHEDSVESGGIFKSDSLFLGATGGLDGKISIWDINNKGLLRTSVQHEEGVIKLKWHASEPILYSCSMDGTLKVIDARTGKVLETLTGHLDGVLDFSLSQDGKTIVSCSDDKRILIFKGQ